MYIKDFVFDGKSATNMGLIIASLDNDSSDLNLGANVTINTSKKIGLHTKYFHSASYDDSISFQLQIFKNNCFKICNQYFSEDDIFDCMRWLQKDNGYRELILISESDKKYCTKAQINVNRIENGNNTCGLSLSVNTYSPFLFDEEYEKKIEITDDSKYFDIKDTSIREGYQMLNIVVEFLKDGDFEFTTLFDGRTTIFTNCKKGEFVNIDGNNQILTSSVQEHKVYEDFNFIFPKIHNTKFNNLNTFVVNIPCKITIKYSPILMVGGVL